MGQQQWQPTQDSVQPQANVQSNTSSDSAASASQGQSNDFLQQQLDGACSEDSREATVEEVLGAGFDDMAADTSDRFWGAVAGLDAMLADIRVQDGTDADLITDLSADGGVLLDDVPVLVDDLLESSCVEGDVVDYDTTLYDDVYDTLDDIELHIDVLDIEGEKWSMVLGLPSLQTFKDMVEVWVKLLASWDARAQEVVKTVQELQELYDAHRAEFDQACMKVGVDTALIAAGVASAALLTGPAALAAGIVLTLSGVTASLVIEGNLSDWGKAKTAMNGANLSAKSLELKGLVGELPSGLKGLGPALNAISLVLDGSEAASEHGLAQQMKDKLEAILAESDDLLAAWPAVVVNLDSSAKQLAAIEHALSAELPSVESLDLEIDGLLAELAA